MNARVRVALLFFVFLFYFPFVKSVFAVDPVINEFLPNPSSGSPEWVEFYNSANTSIDLSDYYFDDDTNFDSDSGSSQKIALSGVLPALQACYWELSSYLNNNGDSPTLFKVQSGISSSVDTYTYASSSAGLSYARVPDGGNWVILQSPTQASNKCIDLAPTSTPTPTLTSTPASTSTPTQTPTPTKTPTPTPSPTKSPTPTTNSTVFISATIEPTEEVFPTSVLGESDIEDEEEKETKVLGSQENNLGKVLMTIGAVFIAVSAILAIRIYVKGRREKSLE